jgi:hypothetical protein
MTINLQLKTSLSKKLPTQDPGLNSDYHQPPLKILKMFRGGWYAKAWQRPLDTKTDFAIIGVDDRSSPVIRARGMTTLRTSGTILSIPTGEASVLSPNQLHNISELNKAKCKQQLTTYW